MKRCIPLEAAAEAVCNQSSIPPLIFQLPPEQGREVLEKAQDAPVYLYPADVSTTEVNTGKWGVVPVYFVMPQGALPQQTVFYIHGGGWVFGSFHTHEKLVRELAARTESLVVFPEYSRSPEAKYPTAIEQCYFILSHLWEIVGNRCSNLAHNTLTVAGDSVGGNMAAAMALMANVTALCIQGTIHDFVMLNALDQTNACRMAMDVSTTWISRKDPSPA